MNLVIRKIGRCPPFSHMGDLLNTCMLWIGLFECHILLENPVEFRYEPEFWLSFRFRSTESGIFKNTTPVPAQPEPDFQYIRYPAGYSGSVSGLDTLLHKCSQMISLLTNLKVKVQVILADLVSIKIIFYNHPPATQLRKCQSSKMDLYIQNKNCLYMYL